jgi:hypothetical protein
MAMQNCWEHRRCGRESSCPAYPLYGRACFAVTGTWCRGEEQASYDVKIDKCRGTCDFYKEIMGVLEWENIGRAVGQ